MPARIRVRGPRPERRTRADLIAAALLTVAVLVAGTTLWWTSDIRGTTLRTADGPGGTGIGSAPGPATIPPSLAEAWRAPSPATGRPVLRGTVAVTGSGGEVAGRDLAGGEVRWSYRRDLPLCTVASGFDRVLAVHRRDGYCSEVTLLQPGDGSRAAQRTGPIEAPTELLAGPSTVAAVGDRYLEVWRSDLVRTLVYGALPAPVRPGAQPRPDCTHGSGALTDGRLAIIERCPGESADRLTLQQADPDEPDEPEVVASVLLPGQGATVVALTPARVAVALPDPARLVVLDASAKPLAEYPLDVPPADLERVSGAAELTSGPGGLFWFSGSATVSLDPTELRPRWTLPGTLGPGALLAGRLLVPVPGALAVLEIATGRATGTLPVDRGGFAGPVAVAATGDVVLEQRGDELVALR